MNDLELDALVAQKVLGLNVVGEAMCASPEGDWVICGAKETLTGHYGTLRPVYLRECRCGNLRQSAAEMEERNPDLREARREEKFRSILFGHNIHACLEVVRCYSTDIAEAWEIFDIVKLRAIRRARGGFDVPYRDCGDPMVHVVVHDCCGSVWAPTAPRAICLAALRSVGVEVESEVAV